MLVSLSIKNYILIESLKLDFCEGLNIITGETGAGKSIILGALNLILGQRADTKANFNPEKKCVVEGVFDIRIYELEDFFTANNLDYEDRTIVRREILPSGKTRAFINDTPTNLSQLSELGQQLIDMHQQWDTLEIRETGYQLYILDILAEHQSLLREYSDKFQDYQETQNKLLDLETENAEAKKVQDFIVFQAEELGRAEIKPGELNDLEVRLNQLENLEEIKRVLQHGISCLDSQDRGILDQLRVFTKDLRNIHLLDPSLKDLCVRVESTLEDLLDIQNESEKLLEIYNENNEDIDEVSSRIDELHKLLSKHQVHSEEELLDLKNEFENKKQRFENLDQVIRDMIETVENLKSWLVKTSNQLSKNRKNAIPILEKTITNNLHALSMPHARLEVQLIPREEPGPKGMDKVNYLFAANKGVPIKPLSKVASGGEISRLNLSLKRLIAGEANLPCLIFDEIDSGLSGEVAMRIGNILFDLSKKHQIVSITHSPQVASRAERHFLVYKGHEQKKSRTYIKLLDKNERIVEIAKMLSGDPPSSAAIDNAKHLIEAQ